MVSRYSYLMRLNNAFFMQLKSLATLGVEGYAVLLNVSNSDCRVLCGSC